MTKSMGRFDHGGDIYAHAGVVDFSANINPLGMPPASKEALVRHIGDYEAYPDVACRELRRAIALAEGTEADHVVCTAGASDLFDRLCFVLHPKTALVTAPCFSGYEQALERMGTHVVRHELLDRDDFGVTESLLGFTRRATEPIDLLFLCNPNNPTGLTLNRDLLVSVLDEAREAGVMVVLDECFLDFTDEPSAVEWCPRYENLVIARAFTKMYAMAGLRVGYGICADNELVTSLAQAGQPWAVSGPAQVAAVAALDDAEWVARTRRYVDEQRGLLARGLRACGMRVVSGRANYLLFQSSRPLFEPLLQRGFLIRRCGNFEGLDESWYRIAVRTDAENEAFLRALGDVCS